LQKPAVSCKITLYREPGKSHFSPPLSKAHPIIAVTGSSGAGTTNARIAFEQIFRREKIRPALIQGDGFHRYDRVAMERATLKAEKSGGRITHFGPEGNLFEELEAAFREYSEHGTGRRRYYIHNQQEAAHRGLPLGALTPWEPLPKETDLLFYEGLHGGLTIPQADIARHVDLLIGVTPIINLEWAQKIHRDREVRGYSAENAIGMILSRMHDYVHYIVPQFSQTHINFQRVPTVDTSNPFTAIAIPTNDESFSVVHIQDMEKLQPDFRSLLEMLDGSFMSTPDTIVVPAGKKSLCMQLILTPVIRKMMQETRRD